MATRSLPTKPAQGAAIEPPRRKGPVKGKRAPTRVKVGGRTRLKPPVKAAARKAPVRKATGGGGVPELPDQEPERRRRSAEQYVRLRVRVEDGDLSIIGGNLVDGPLAQTTAFQGSHAYEVTDGDRLLHAGSIADLGVFRSFAHPTGTPEQQQHHTYELGTYEFDARVPADALTRAALPKLSVVLYRVKERATPRGAEQALFAVPLGAQRERELREVGRVDGFPASVLPSALSKTGVRRTAQPPGAKRQVSKRRSKKHR